jgi:membrane-bound lytic murein transglycosylase D
VTTPKQIDAKLAAQLAEISFDEFSALNPSYNRPVITSTGEKNQLLLPVWAAERFVDNLANYDKPLTSWQTYNAKRGERMDKIATKFGIGVSQLRNVNGISANNKLRSSQAMLVPAAYHPSSNSLTSISNQAPSIDVNEMESNNVENLSDNDTTADEPKAGYRVIHKIKKGETLLAIAGKYNTSTLALMKINGLKTSKVKVGQKLTIKDSGFKSGGKLGKVNSTKLNATKTSSVRLINKTKHTRLGLKVGLNKKIAKNGNRSAKHTTTHISARTHIRLR